MPSNSFHEVISYSLLIVTKLLAGFGETIIVSANISLTLNPGHTSTVMVTSTDGYFGRQNQLLRTNENNFKIWNYKIYSLDLRIISANYLKTYPSNTRFNPLIKLQYI